MPLGEEESIPLLLADFCLIELLAERQLLLHSRVCTPKLFREFLFWSFWIVYYRVGACGEYLY